MRPKVRKAVHEDMDGIFLMGHAAWGKGEGAQQYLASCRNSPKYKQGEWYVLDHEEHGAIASLILYRLTANSAGIGSIATVPERRKQGFGAHLVQTIVSLLDLQSTRAIFRPNIRSIPAASAWFVLDPSIHFSVTRNSSFPPIFEGARDYPRG
jgi:GNAT superfamily N-acetyltransferase